MAATCLAPYVRKKVSTGGWVFFILFLFFPICWIGFLMKEDEMHCRVCNARVGG